MRCESAAGAFPEALSTSLVPDLKEFGIMPTRFVTRLRAVAGASRDRYGF
jgi:hypothetical protein